MNNNQYIPNGNEEGMSPSQHHQYNLNYNQIANQQIPLMTSQINNFPINQQQANLNRYNIYFQNNPQIQSLTKNPNGQAILLNSQFSPIALYKQSQQIYHKTRLPSTPEQFHNSQFNNQQIQLHQQLQQAQIQQFNQLQQFSNPLHNLQSSNEQNQSQQQQLQQNLNLHLQHQPKQTLQQFQQISNISHQQINLQHQQQINLQQQLQKLQQQQQLKLSQKIAQPQNIINKNNKTKSNNALSSNYKIDKEDSSRKFLKPVFPLMKPWDIKLKNAHEVYTNTFEVFDDFHCHISEYKISSVILTCFVINEYDKKKMEWPFCIKTIKCNGEILNITRKKPIYGNDGHLVQTEGINLPFDITKYVHPESNLIEIETDKIEGSTKEQIVNTKFQIDFNVLESEEECKKNIKNDIFPEEKTLEIIKKQTVGSNNDDDDDLIIIDSTLTISLKCPISFSRIKNPVRGNDCQHVQTFELNSYLYINYKHGKWECPICSKHTTIADLKFDKWFDTLLKKVPEDIDKVEIDEYGNFQIINANKIQQSTSKVVYDLDSNDIEEIDNSIKQSNIINIDSIGQKSKKEVNNNINTNDDTTSSSFNGILINNNSKRNYNELQYLNEEYTSKLKKRNISNANEYPDIGPINFVPIFDRLTKVATKIDLNNKFNY